MTSARFGTVRAARGPIEAPPLKIKPKRLLETDDLSEQEELAIAKDPKLDSQIEVLKWINMRRKNYPR